MLSKTLDDTMSKAMMLENITKASRFSNQIANDKIGEDDFVMLSKISDYIKTDNAVKDINIDEISDYIVEKPEQKSRIFDFDNVVSTGLPFFKSIEYKLTQTFG